MHPSALKARWVLARHSWVLPVCFLFLAQVVVVVTLGTGWLGPPFNAVIDLATNVLCLYVLLQAARRSSGLARYFWNLAMFSTALFCLSGLLNIYIEVIKPSRSIAELADMISLFWFGPVSLTLFLDPDFELNRFDRIHILDFIQVVLFWIAIYFFFLYLPAHEPSGSVLMAWNHATWAGGLVYDGSMAALFILRSVLTDSPVVRILFKRTSVFLILVCVADFYYNFHSMPAGTWYQLIWTLLNIAPIVIAGTWNQAEVANSAIGAAPTRSGVIGDRLFPVLYAFFVLILSICIVREHVGFALAMVSVSFVCSSARAIIIQQREQRVEEELREHKEHLEDEVAQRTAELVEANTQLRQAQKMEALGRLAGGIAHDFNNLLTVITGYSSLLRDVLANDPASLDKVDQIYRAGGRASELTQQLLTFSRRQILQPKALNLNEILADCEKMLQRVLGEDIELKTFADPSLGLIRADPGQITQIIVNLAVNARDAMPEGGKLTLTTANTTLAESHNKLPDMAKPGPYVEFTVADTGCGMDAETQAHIFEPFFTTKGQSKGTGLGLATVYGIVEQNGGHISVDSAIGRGTAFRVYLPRFEGLPASELPPMPAAQLGGSETILAVEDQDAVRTLVCEVLQKNGYNVLPASNGRDALLLLKQYRSRIHLMITDVVMPQMDGRQLAQALGDEHPESKVLFMSGYTDKTSQNEIIASGLAFIQKPFTPEALVRRVREVLDTPRRSGTKSIAARES